MSEKQKSETISARETLRTVLIAVGLAGIALIALYLLRSFASALLLIFAGILFGVFLDAVTNLVMKWCRLRRGFALTLVVVLGLTLCVVFWWLVGPQVVQQAQVLIQQLPESLAVMQKQIERYEWGRAIVGSLPSFGQFQLSFASILGSVTQALTIIAELAGIILFIFFVGLYLAATPDVHIDGILRLIPRGHKTRGREVIDALGLALRWWLLGRAITMMLMGILTTIALWLAHVPLALVLGVIAGVLLFVPYLGAVASAIPAILIALLESPSKALWVALIYTGVHVFEGYAITPFVQKRAVALPPALLLSVQILSAALFGIPGVIFSTPLMVVAIVLIQTLYVQDVLGERVAILGEHDSSNKR